MALSDKEFAVKAANLDLTLGDVIDYALERPNLSKTQKERIGSMRTAMIDNTQLKLSTPFHEMRDEVNWSQLDPDINGSGNSYYYNMQNLETVVHKKMQELGVKDVMMPGPAGVGVAAYPKIAGSDSISGGTQRTGQKLEQPMRGLLRAKDIQQIYNEAIPEIEAKYGKPVADALTYHLVTFHRPTQIVGDTAIKLSDVTILDDQIIVKQAKAGHKTRPEHVYPRNSTIGQLIERNYNREVKMLENTTTAKALSGADSHLFKIPKATFEKAFRESISPRLMVFQDVLPLNNKTGNPIATPSAVRSFMPRMLRQEAKYPKDLIQALQGHVAGATIDRSYIGRDLPPEEGTGLLVNHLAETQGAPDKFQMGAIGSDAVQQQGLIAYTEEQMERISEARAAEADVTRVEAEAKVLEAEKDLVAKRQEKVAYWKSEEGQRLLEEEAEIEAQKAEKKAEARKKLQPPEEPPAKAFEFTAEETEELKRGFDEAFGVEEDVTTDMDDPDAPKKGGKAAKVGKAFLTSLPVAGMVLSGQTKAEEYEEEVKKGMPKPIAGALKAGEFIAEEFSPYGIAVMAQQMGELLDDVQPGTTEEQLSDPYSFTDADVMLIDEAKKAREKSDVESFGRFMEEDLIQP
jgi:hypothetical protein